MVLFDALGEGGKFSYLPLLVPFLVIEYMILVIYFWRKHTYYQNSEDEQGANEGKLNGADTMNRLGLAADEDFLSVEAGPPAAGRGEAGAISVGAGIGCGACRVEVMDWSTILEPCRFEAAFLSYGYWSERALLCSRFLSFGYLCGVGVLYRADLVGFKADTVGWQFFTSWNLYMLSFYYSVALLASLIGVNIKRRDGHLEVETVENWSIFRQRLGVAVYILYEVLGASAFMVTTVAFTLLDSNPSFWNCTFHLATTISIIIELALNRMTVKLMHMPFGLSWAMLYTSFIWLTVWLGGVSSWPYPFLDTSTPYCLLWYSGLVICFLVYFCLFTFLSQTKMKLHEGYLHSVEEAKQVGLESDLLGARDNTYAMRSYSQEII
jgi:hypothetical protein